MAPAADATHERRLRRRYVAVAVLIVLFAFSLRVLYVETAQVDSPIYGDSVQYMAYAWNLLHHQTFSSSPAGSAVPVPDAYRGPGYAVFLALAMWSAGGNVRVSIYYVQIIQCALGALTVLLVILLGRTWLSRGLALGAGVLVACWPHLITFCGTLMSETLFGFFLVMSFWFLSMGERGSRTWQLAAAGLAFGCAYLVNPVILFFPLLAGLLLVRLGQWRCAAVLVVCFSSIVAGWGWRNAGLPYEYGATRRAAENFVEGSIPLYMRAFNSRWVSPDAKRIVDVADNETALLLHDPAAGMNAVFDRMRQQPGAYLSWYLLQKPWKLWDWGIVIGTGDIYYPVTQRSPLERIAVLRAMKQLFEWVNPAFFVLAMFAALWLLLRVWVCRTIPFMAAAMAVFVIYVTGVHVVFQAEPRYSVPYRPEEVLLALTALAWVSALWSRRSSSASLTGNPAA